MSLGATNSTSSCYDYKRNTLTTNLVSCTSFTGRILTHGHNFVTSFYINRGDKVDEARTISILDCYVGGYIDAEKTIEVGGMAYVYSSNENDEIYIANCIDETQFNVNSAGYNTTSYSYAVGTRNGTHKGTLTLSNVIVNNSKVKNVYKTTTTTDAT